MKIIVCGIPPAQARAIERRFRGHDVRILGAQEPEQRYLAHMTRCDLCVVNASLISHKMSGIVRRFVRNAIFVHGPSSAVAAIESALGSHA